MTDDQIKHVEASSEEIAEWDEDHDDPHPVFEVDDRPERKRVLSYRVFCAYGPHYREPGCGWEAFVDSEEEAERLAKKHGSGQTHVADYERISSN